MALVAGGVGCLVGQPLPDAVATLTQHCEIDWI
jgi:hypothetical protein